MNEGNMSVSGNDAQDNTGGIVAVTPDTGSGPDTLEPGLNTVSGGDSVSGTDTGILSLYDDELGGVPVVIVDDRSSLEDETALLADTGNMGYQVSDYWLNYFRGVLQKLGDVDYCVFSTRENTGSSNYVQHYYLYYAQDMGEDTIKSGTYTCYDAYASNSVYYVDISQEYLGNVSQGRLVYSNIGKYSDIREGVSHYDSWALLFFLGFFAVYTVCHDIFDYVMGHIYRK